MNNEKRTHPLSSQDILVKVKYTVKKLGSLTPPLKNIPRRAASPTQCIESVCTEQKRNVRQHTFKRANPYLIRHALLSIVNTAICDRLYLLIFGPSRTCNKCTYLQYLGYKYVVRETVSLRGGVR